MEGRPKESAPRWLPISLLAFSTVAMLGPVFLFRKQLRARGVQNVKLSTSAPPRRAASTTNALPIRTAPMSSVSSSPLPLSTSKATGRVQPPAGAPKLFNALGIFKAFSYATLFVTAGAATTVYTVQYSLGVQNTQEFAERMREIITKKMPVLSSKLYGPPSQSDDAKDSAPSESAIDENWKWEEAEKRLGDAYERGGISQWAQVALDEVEREQATERARRRRA